MIVQDVSGLPPTLKGLLTTNPFDSDLRDSEKLIAITEASEKNARINVAEYLRKVEEQKIIAQIEKQKLVIGNKRLKVIEKAYNDANLTVDASYLETSKLVAFFNSIGCKFVLLRFHDNQERASLEYIRYGGFINLLPVPPMLIKMDYQRKNGKLAFYKPEVFGVFSNGNYIHPHISSYSVCMGNYFDILDKNNYSILLDGYQEHVILLNNLLSTYNPDSPYRTIDRIIGDTAKRLRLDSEVETSFNDHNSYTFFNPEIDKNRNEIYRLIGRKDCEEYINNLKSIKLKDIGEDLYARLLTESHDSSDSEMHEAMEGIESEINSLFPQIEWSSLSDYESIVYNENNDEDYSELIEDSFDDLIGCWKDELRTWIDGSDIYGYLQLKQIPDLNEFFGHEPLQEVSDVSN